MLELCSLTHTRPSTCADSSENTESAMWPTWVKNMQFGPLFDPTLRVKVNIGLVSRSFTNSLNRDHLKMHRSTPISYLQPGRRSLRSLEAEPCVRRLAKLTSELN